MFLYRVGISSSIVQEFLEALFQGMVQEYSTCELIIRSPECHASNFRALTVKLLD